MGSYGSPEMHPKLTNNTAPNTGKDPNILIFCPNCGTRYIKTLRKCPNCGKRFTPLKIWHLVVSFFVGIVAIIALALAIASPTDTQNNIPLETAETVPETHDSGQTEQLQPNSNQNQNIQPQAETQGQESQNDNIPTEYKSALKKAETYSDMMHMSRQAIYDQLTSEYGEKFTPEAAQYAIDNLKTDYKLNALEKAKTYQEMMNMSPSKIYDQLISEYGERFTVEEAEYAIENLE